MKEWGLIFILSLILVFGVAFSQPVNISQAVTDNPAGTMTFTGKTEREVSVKAGDKLNVTVNMSSGDKVCNIILDTIKADAGARTSSVKQVVVPWKRGTAQGNVAADIDTTGLSAGKYRVFMEGYTNCGDDTVHGNEDDGFDCDGNPTCWSYCNGEGGGGTRTKIDTTATAYQPRDPIVNNGNEIYRTSINTGAYYKVIPGKNSCGEPNDKGSPIDPNYRLGQCDLKACDRSGQNKDNLAFTVGGSSGSVPGTVTPPATGSGTIIPPATGGTPPASNTVVTIPAGAPGQVVVNSSTKTTDMATGSVINVTAGVVSANTDGAMVVAGDTKNVKNYVGGNIVATPSTDGTPSKGADLTNQRIGGVNVAVGKAVSIVAANGVSTQITSKDLAKIVVSLPDKATVLAPTTWDGLIKPPTTVSGALGSAPAGFQIGDTVMSVGSDKDTLLLDKPATITLTDTVGPMFYKNANGAVTAIGKCNTGSYATPVAPPFPGECYLTSDDNKNTKIITYHMTTFGNMELQGPSMLSIDPGVCADRRDPTNFIVQLQMAPSAIYNQYFVYATACRDYNSCTGTEKLRSQGVTISPILSTAISDGNLPADTKYYRYRVWGLMNGRVTPTDLSPDKLDSQYWSLSQVVKVGCEGLGTGINLKELVIPPKATEKPRPAAACTTKDANGHCIN